MASGRTSGANTTPLGRPNPALLNPKQASSSSLLKPSYMSQPGGKRDREDEYEFLERSVLGYPDAASFDRVWGSRTSPNMFSISRMSEVKSSMPDEDFSISAVRLAFEESTNWPPESTSWPPDGQDRKKKKRSRWGGDDKEKVFIPGLPTVLPNNLNPQQERAYLLQLQIEEISRRLRTGDLGIPPNPEDRSPSPEPIYNSEGKRLNTREYRTRKKLEDDRHSLIQEMYSCNPDYKPPADYKPPLVKVSEKVMIPQEEHPDINFVGLLIGPRGNTLKAMEKETGAKIIIRGKGSVKEGKVGRKDGQPLPGEDEPLHAFVTGNSNESVKKAVNKIREIIRQGVEVPEGQNDLRCMQLRELALLNGTLRENNGPRCTNCGATTHRSWQCPDKPNVTNNVICTSCGGAGHIAKDCREQKKVTGPFGPPDKSKIDEEYMSLMAELGEGPPPPTKLTSIGTNQSTVTPLAAPPGPPRAIMAPPSQHQFQVTTVSTQSPWSGNVQNKPTMMSTGTPPATVLQSSVFVPSLVMSQQASHNFAAQSGMPPWQQTFQAPNALQPTASAVLTTQGVSPVASMLAQPPPPPPPPTGSQTHLAVSAPWLATHQSNVAQGIPTSPWQISPQQPGSGPLPVPPPGVTAIPPPAMASIYPWANFMGVPPPPPIQTTVQTLAAAPPPPTSNAVQTASTTNSVTQSVDLSALALPNLLTAPPPPPPS